MSALKDVLGPRLADGGVPRPMATVRPAGDPLQAAIARQRMRVAVQLEQEAADTEAEALRARRLQTTLERRKAELELAKLDGNGHAGGGELGALIGVLVESQKAADARANELLGMLLAQQQAPPSPAPAPAPPSIADQVQTVMSLRDLLGTLTPPVPGADPQVAIELKRMEMSQAIELQRLGLETEAHAQRHRLEQAKIDAEQARANKLGDLVENLAPGVVQMFGQHIVPAITGGGGGRPQPALGGGQAEPETEQPAPVAVSCPGCNLRMQVPVPDGTATIAQCPRCKSVIKVNPDRQHQPGRGECGQCGAPTLLDASGRPRCSNPECDSRA